jgi:hypothetical protein
MGNIILLFACLAIGMALRKYGRVPENAHTTLSKSAKLKTCCKADDRIGIWLGLAPTPSWDNRSAAGRPWVGSIRPLRLPAGGAV